MTLSEGFCVNLKCILDEVYTVGFTIASKSCVTEYVSRKSMKEVNWLMHRVKLRHIIYGHDTFTVLYV